MYISAKMLTKNAKPLTKIGKSSHSKNNSMVNFNFFRASTLKYLITQTQYNLDQFLHQIDQNKQFFIIRWALEQVKSPR